jgi:D-alanine--poly(phosphoribitol) ligase subunit 2
MTLDRHAIKSRIRAKFAELSAALGNDDPGGLTDDAIIPATGLLDSAALLDLVVWYEAEFDLPLTQEEINVDNLGSIDAMADYLIARKTT